ncbi:MAG: integrase core domain-containing protein, partial [Bacteroidota bacterium]
PFIEKFHDIVKNHYLIPWKVDSESLLDLALNRFMNLYNFDRPHGSLGGMTPAAFEAMALKMPEKRRKTMCIKSIT